VLWRGDSGGVTAFENRCAHRAFPLSHSTVDGDRLVCGYHGCTYDATGKCVHIPSQTHVPTGMRVRVFPVLEQPPFVWIWLGQPAAAVGSEPPHTLWIDDPAWTTFASVWQVSANCMMVHEHYLHFSYAPIVHRRDVPPEIESMPAFNDVEVTETTVSYTRLLPEARLVANLVSGDAPVAWPLSDEDTPLLTHTGAPTRAAIMSVIRRRPYGAWERSTSATSSSPVANGVKNSMPTAATSGSATGPRSADPPHW
jgi:phenylpropionate dioxygenase-like ring-hydroxylating dioxygenase large terminal subunit